jgi:hypothetical protein
MMRFNPRANEVAKSLSRGLVRVVIDGKFLNPEEGAIDFQGAVSLETYRNFERVIAHALKEADDVRALRRGC